MGLKSWGALFIEADAGSELIESASLALDSFPAVYSSASSLYKHPRRLI